MNKTQKLWKCPRCNRKFANKNQQHSCVLVRVAEHFEGKASSVKETFNFLLSRLEKLGPIRVDAVKTAINLSGKEHFAMIYPRKDSLVVAFSLREKLSDERVFRVTKIGNNMFEHYVKLQNKGDVDNQLIGWLSKSIGW